ncbi:hypothetical protein [Cnuella takakiae]|uniref:hypothetical protein n=1 Tax=Cnuella takakiae TaxID=1302690 RepID=UPI001160C4F9|nr:hypothetical protein [Cnuella takakiae]
MQNRNLNQRNLSGRVGAAGLVALAVLLLFFSCPMKRLLHEHVSIPVAANKGQHTKTRHIVAFQFESGTFCYATQKQESVTGARVTHKQNLPSSDNVTTDGQSGFSIYYFLSGIYNSTFSFSTTPLTQLPLFLQHRRLLI